MTFLKKQKKISPNEAYRKISSWCAYQERSHKEVRNKLYELNLHKDIIEELIFRLMTENFLNEERFARSYAGGKFRIKKWGRRKIEEGLKEKGISSNCVKIAFAEIDEEDYLKQLDELATKRLKEMEKEKDPYVKSQKIASYLIRKGYETDLVWELLKKK